MRYILDTHTLLWALMCPEKIPEPTTTILLEPSNTLFVSVVSHWEIAIKESLGRLVPPRNLDETIIESGFTPLSLTAAHCLAYGKLPLYPEHRDPFDRMLAVQSRMEQATLISRDEKLDLYDIDRAWQSK
ncbi:type II toxin-antitoxin system VapC family toxin [Endothiovibrio diazotrophicus]